MLCWTGLRTVPTRSSSMEMTPCAKEKDSNLNKWHAEERFAKHSFAISFQNNTPVDSRPWTWTCFSREGGLTPTVSLDWEGRNIQFRFFQMIWGHQQSYKQIQQTATAKPGNLNLKIMFSRKSTSIWNIYIVHMQYWLNWILEMLLRSITARIKFILLLWQKLWQPC